MHSSHFVAPPAGPRVRAGQRPPQMSVLARQPGCAPPWGGSSVVASGKSLSVAHPEKRSSDLPKRRRVCASERESPAHGSFERVRVTVRFGAVDSLPKAVFKRANTDESTVPANRADRRHCRPAQLLGAERTTLLTFAVFLSLAIALQTPSMRSGPSRASATTFQAADLSRERLPQRRYSSRSIQRRL